MDSKEFKIMPSTDLIRAFERSILENDHELRVQTSSELLDRCAYAMANRGD